MPSRLPFFPWLLCGLLLAGAGRAQTVSLETVVVTAGRAESPLSASPFETRVFSADALKHSPALTLDSALRSLPAFSLFRRSDSLVSHPTTQGVSLRGVGPSGASRSLVLFDGVPLNDPFGGWVTWSKLPREGLARVEIAPGAGATAWGNAALGGVIQLLSQPPSDGAAGSASLLVGDFSTRRAEGYVQQPVGTGSLVVDGGLFSTAGYRVVAPETAGSVDAPAWARHQRLGLRWSGRVAPAVQLTTGLRWFHERRGNGTAYTGNATDDLLVSASLQGRPAEGIRWTATAYAEDESFSSTFSAVNADRSSETPASNQHDVPARAAGASAVAEWTHAGGARVVAGADLRAVRGESREWYAYSDGQFTRAREAGGKQLDAGLFVLGEQPLGAGWRATLGSRLDHWTDSGGFRHEWLRASGGRLRDETYEARRGWEWSPSAGISWQATAHLRWRLSGQRAFRRPTLNELYRPFRVGNVITEANPRLGTESNTTVESGLTLRAGRLTADVAGFWNELRNAVGNVTVAHGPGTVPGFGFIPAGGVGRLRENIERVRIRGLEASGRWELAAGLSLTGDVLLEDAEVTRSVAAPDLVGKRVAQVPRTSASAGIRWEHGGWTLSSRARWMGAQFEDDENTLRLAPAWVVDASVVRRIGAHAEVFFSAENLFNERIETGRSAIGVTNVGAPRFATVGVRLDW